MVSYCFPVGRLRYAYMKPGFEVTSFDVHRPPVSLRSIKAERPVRVLAEAGFKPVRRWVRINRRQMLVRFIQINVLDGEGYA